MKLLWTQRFCRSMQLVTTTWLRRPCRTPRCLRAASSVWSPTNQRQTRKRSTRNQANRKGKEQTVVDPSQKRRGLKLSLEFVSVTHLTSCVLELWSSEEYHRQKPRGCFLYYIWWKERRHPAKGGLNYVASCSFGLLTKFQWLVAVHKFWCNISLIEYTPSFCCILPIMQFIFVGEKKQLTTS